MHKVLAGILRDTGALAALAASLMLFSTAFWLGAGGLIVSQLSPCPLAYIYFTRGRAGGLVFIGAGLVLCGVAFATAGMAAGLLMFAQYALIAVVLAEALRRALPLTQTVGYTVAAIALVFVAVILITGLFAGRGPLAQGRLMVETQVGEVVDALAQAPQGPQGQKYDPQVVRRALITLFPGLLLMGALIVVWLNLLILLRLVARVVTLPPASGDLGGWRAPGVLVWAGVAALVLTIIPAGASRAVGYNALLVLGAAYFLAGLSIISYWFKMVRVPPLMQALAYFFILMWLFVTPAVALLGFFDYWLDIRNRIKPRNLE